MREILEKVKNGVLDVVFPTMCMGCGKEGHYICMRCEGFVGEVALICPVCGQSSLTGQQHQACRSLYGLDGLASCFEYEGVVKNLLHHIKYNGMTHAVKETTARVLGIMLEDTARFYPFLSFLSSQNIHITYVPMYKKKERDRGFNQAEMFAKEIAKSMGKEVFTMLEKIKDTKPQVALKKEERLQNVKDAFAVSRVSPHSAVGADSTLPEKVILVDDVWTTGATMKECCRVLKKAGAKEVWGFTLARTS
ncbi:MAG: ComF family protein [bacterium]|nr:ComF family protein [bacterium]